MMRSKELIAILATAGTLFGFAKVTVPMDPDAASKVREAVTAANQEGNFATALRESRRLLEFYPNNPMVQAAIYLEMADVAERSGENAAAAEYASIARAIDPGIDKRLDRPAGSTTRGDAASKWAKALIIAGNAIQAAQASTGQIQQQRMAAQAQQLQQLQMELQIRQTQAQLQQLQAGQAQQPATYPQYPVNDPNYQGNPAMAAPPPGWGPPQGAAPQYAQPGNVQYAQPGNVQYAQPGNVQYAQPGNVQYAQPGNVQYAQPATPQYPPAPAGQYPQYPTAPSPYTPPAGYAGAVGVTRGEKAPVFKVLHDHSIIGDKAYFDPSCGALLSVAGGNLTFTPMGGERPMVIASGDIADIRLNVAVGREAGAFHIATKKGMWLHLAPESGSRDEARTDVEELRKLLHLGQ